MSSENRSRIDLERLPVHIAIIMDGNGRWANERGLKRIEGHKKGGDVVDDITTYARQLGIKYLTLYAFSTENWQRDPEEVSFLMQLLADFLREKREKILNNNIRLNAIGNIDDLPQLVKERLIAVMNESSKNSEMVLTLALSYGSRSEIVNAVKSILRDSSQGKISVDELTEQRFSDYLYTKGMPDPDILLRTGGEKRISNFLLYQISYSELIFVEKKWPDFTPSDLEEAIIEFQRRQRRFGRAKSII
ncbi:MAG: isoprenyl transferase [Deltaproteobacteria bacterium]|nr:isoprenyl transferase [Deltaproteobacteria bacterium]